MRRFSDSSFCSKLFESFHFIFLINFDEIIVSLPHQCVNNFVKLF
ncbi:conserved hypothetical protein [Escherichia phage AR1]|uniref:Uncharacterized protein n=1 Tax=Escherichia phage AR1 TaxID=66711 RepID=D4Z9U3_BPAR1|nr:hypothetical protein AR1_148 [Escherichia phage AR1]BAI83155.1 conserved hypothetical protein [Escherichia phage AR1]